MQHHRVCLIEEGALPAGHDWALVEHDERITLFITEAALTPLKLEEAWAGYRLLTSPRHPAPRIVQPRMPTSSLLHTA